MRLKVIACESLRAEVCAAAARSPHRINLEFLPGLGKLGAGQLQEAIDRSSTAPYDAIVLVWGGCGEAATGIECRRIRLVAPRTRECFGARSAAKGVCFRSSGWREADRMEGAKLRMVEDAGEPAAAQYKTYRQMIYISTAPRQGAKEKRQPRPHPPLDHAMFDRLLAGAWDESEFVVVPPGWRLRVSADGRVMEREPIA